MVAVTFHPPGNSALAPPAGFPTVDPHALLHPAQSPPAARQLLLARGIIHHDGSALTLPQQADSHLDGARVLNDVGEGLLYHPVDGQPLRLVERSFLPLDGEGAVGAGAVGVADAVLDTGHTRGGADVRVSPGARHGEPA